jgi:hypothetical protein
LASSQSSAIAGSITRHRAAPSEVGPNNKTLVTSAQEVQLVAKLLLSIIAKADKESLANIGTGLIVRTSSIGGIAVRIGQLLDGPRLL